jgi:ABC-2 type transport system permease protein
VLGFFWTFLNPLLQLLVYTLVFSIMMKNGIEKYYLFLFIALVPWIFFSTCISAGSTCVSSQQDMVKKIYFPREVLPIAFVTSQFVNMLLTFVVVFAVIIVSGVGINFVAVLFLPIVMLVEYLLAIGITFFISAVTVFFKDMQYIMNIISMVWMYMTPVLYPESIVPEKYLGLYKLNPVTPIVIAYRDILYYKKIPDLSNLLSAIILGVVFLVIGTVSFSRMKRHFAEEM